MMGEITYTNLDVARFATSSLGTWVSCIQGPLTVKYRGKDAWDACAVSAKALIPSKNKEYLLNIIKKKETILSYNEMICLYLFRNLAAFPMAMHGGEIYDDYYNLEFSPEVGSVVEDKKYFVYAKVKYDDGSFSHLGSFYSLEGRLCENAKFSGSPVVHIKMDLQGKMPKSL